VGLDEPDFILTAFGYTGRTGASVGRRERERERERERDRERQRERSAQAYPII